MKSTQLDQSDYMGCQQQRRMNIDVLKVAFSMSEHCKVFMLNVLSFCKPVAKVQVVRIKVS